MKDDVRIELKTSSLSMKAENELKIGGDTEKAKAYATLVLAESMLKLAQAIKQVDATLHAQREL
jgi:hypothetical protein